MVKKKSEDFNHYMSSVLQNSMLTGVPQIASAGNLPKKIIRALVFVLCVAGFIYQSMVFMRMYWEYQTVIDVRVENPRRAEMPSMTFCSNNGLMTSKMCKSPEWSSNCVKVTNDFEFDWCDCMPHWCKNGEIMNITIPTLHTVEMISYAPYEVYKPWLVSFEEQVENCYIEFKEIDIASEDCSMEYYKNIRCPTVQSDHLHSCYTVHTLLDKPDEEQPTALSQASEFYLINTMPLEYNVKVRHVELHFSIHHAKNILNPYTYGYTLQPGYKNTFRLRKTRKLLLPPPYETNCIDYLKLWKDRGGKGPTSEKECIEECQLNSSLSIIGCVSRMLRVPTNERICLTETEDEAVLTAAHECTLKNCRPACYEETYDTLKDLVQVEAGFACGKEEYFPGGYIRDFAMVEINYDGMQTTTYIYSPKFQNIETFSYLGGYVGMWLGISLVAVFDFLETMVVMLKYPFRRMMKMKAKRKQMDRIRKIHREM